MISKLKRRKKRSSLEKKRRVKYGLRISRERSGLSTESSEGSSASAPQKKVKPALEVRSNGYNGCNGGWPSARLFGWSAADWSRPATNQSISSERKRKSLLFCWERKSWTSCCWPAAAKRVQIRHKTWQHELHTPRTAHRVFRCFQTQHPNAPLHAHATFKYI